MYLLLWLAVTLLHLAVTRINLLLPVGRLLGLLWWVVGLLLSVALWLPVALLPIACLRILGILSVVRIALLREQLYRQQQQD